MRSRLRNRVTFLLERLMLRGALWRLLVVALVIGLLAVAGGLLVLGGGGHFSGAAEAIWWAFLRLTDTGYLGEDVGVWPRIVSTALTVVGSVIFLGALIAVMTQWLNAVIRRLEHGYTPIAARDHVVILGWNDRTPTIVQELLLSEARVRRFLRRRGARALRVAILSEEVGPAQVQELRDALGPRYDGRRIILRSGTPLRLEHLDRVDVLHAAVVVLPGVDFGGQLTIGAGVPATTLTIADTLTIKTLMSVANLAATRHADPPAVVAEVADARKVVVAENAYPGAVEVVASDLIISRLIAQNVRSPGLSHVTTELLTHSRGNEIFVRELPGAAGMRFDALARALPRAIPLGVMRQEGRRAEPVLNPRPDMLLAEADRLVIMARRFEDIELDAGAEPSPAPAGTPNAPQGSPSRRQVLILGWSHRVPALVSEFNAYTHDRFAIDILSVVPPADRERMLERYLAGARQVEVRQLEGDYTVPSELALAAPASYDNVVLVGSDWLEGREESDARTVLGYVLVRDALRAAREGGRAPDLLVELMDPGNQPLFREQPGEVLISPQIVSHILAQVALRPELGSVFDNLFGPEGAEILFRPATAYVAGDTATFRELQAAAHARNETAIGIRLGAERDRRGGGVRLNPSRGSSWTLGTDDHLIVLVTP